MPSRPLSVSPRRRSPSITHWRRRSASAVVGFDPLFQMVRPRLRSLLTGIVASMPDPINYAALRGLPKSFGREAGEYALQGQTPEFSADQWSIATFAGGCFWGTELHYQRMEGVVATCVGYTQGKTSSPTYNQVCSGRTGHTEACQIIYDPQKVSYLDLVEKLFATIDPTLRDQVGNDYGTQYRHGVYAHSDEQLEVAKAFVAEQQKLLPRGRMIHTEVKRATVFWPAEEEHQQFLAKGGRFGSSQSVAKGCRDPVRCYG